jgi:hypothetical protein
MGIPEFCPSCGAIMEKVPMNIHGTVYDFWVCPEGDWESPASAEAEIATANKPRAEDS